MAIKTFVLQNSANKEERHEAVQKAVSEYLGAGATVVYDDKGKPSVTKAEKASFISVTTTGKVMLCVLSDVPVGIDGEHLPRFSDANNKTDYLALAERFFSDDEAEFVRDGLGTEAERFVRVWVRKEAYVKCTGKTLAQFPTFSVVDGAKLFPKVNGVPIKKFNIKFPESEEYLFAIAGAE